MTRFSRRGSIGIVTLSNPPANLMTEPGFADAGALSAFLETPDLVGAVVTGEGRHFCGGADLARLADQARDPRRLSSGLEQGKALLDLLRFATVPIVAAIRGQCLGGGFEIALACHFRVASKGAMFGFPESSHGLVPGLGGTLLREELGFRGLVDLVLSGRLVDAEEAQSTGFVDRIVDAGQVEAAAEKLLADLTEGKPPGLVRSIMESIQNGRRLPRAEALRRETELFCRLAGVRSAG